MITTEGSSYSYNIAHFDPRDPVIVSEAEIYCSTDCCARAVVKEEIEYDWLVGWLVDSKTNVLELFAQLILILVQNNPY